VVEITLIGLLLSVRLEVALNAGGDMRVLHHGSPRVFGAIHRSKTLSSIIYRGKEGGFVACMATLRGGKQLLRCHFNNFYVKLRQHLTNSFKTPINFYFLEVKLI
jgi:hypothetical protein